MERAFPHRVEYENGTASIEEVIENLKAQRKLLSEGVALVDAALQNLQVESVKIKVVKAGSGSLITEFLVLVYGAYQSDVQGTVVGGIERLFDTDIPVEFEPLVTLATLSVTYFVARYAYDAVRAKRPERPASTHIAGDYNAIINVFADRLMLPASEIENALARSVPANKRRQLIKPVTKFLRPREDGKPTPIKIDGYGNIGNGFLSEYPIDSELDEIDDSRNLDIPGAILDIRRTDKDMSSAGWAAQLVNDRRFPKRMPMDLYPTVDTVRLAALANREPTVGIVGDVVIEGKRSSDGRFRGKRIHLLNFREPDVDAEPAGK